MSIQFKCYYYSTFQFIIVLYPFSVRSRPVISAFTNTLLEEQDLTLTCNANYSIPAPTFVWTKGDSQLFSNADTSIQTRSEVGDLGLMTYSSVLFQRHIHLIDSGNYSCYTSQTDSRLSSPVNSSSNIFRVSVFSKLNTVL